MKYKLTSEPLIFLYTTIFTINYTVLPQLVMKKICIFHRHNETLCSDENFLSKDIDVKMESTVWWFFLLLASLFPSLFTVLVWGPVADKIGRRKAMMFVPFVNALRSLVYLINAYFIEANVAYLLFGSFLSCFYGEFQGVVALCYGYLADITTNSLDQRTMRMAFIEASLFFAGIPAGLASGYLLQHLGFVSVFGLNIGINLCILLYVIFYLPKDPNSSYEKIPGSESALNEGIPETGDAPGKSNYTDTESKGLLNNTDKVEATDEGFTNSSLFNPFAQLRHVFRVVTSRSCRAVVIPVVLSFGFSVCAVYGELVVQTLYLQNQPFAFKPQEIGYYSASQSAIRGLGVILLTQWSYHYTRLNDHILIIMGLVSQIVCYISIGLARKYYSVFLANLAGLGIPVATATLRSLATKNVSSDNYGAVLASLEAMDVIASILTNAATLWTYNLTLHLYSGVAFFSLSLFAFIALLFLWLGYCLTKYRIRTV